MGDPTGCGVTEARLASRIYRDKDRDHPTKRYITDPFERFGDWRYRRRLERASRVRHRAARRVLKRVGITTDDLSLGPPEKGRFGVRRTAPLRVNGAEGRVEVEEGTGMRTVEVFVAGRRVTDGEKLRTVLEQSGHWDD